jgi:hypothetical protein
MNRAEPPLAIGSRVQRRKRFRDLPDEQAEHLAFKLLIPERVSAEVVAIQDWL